MTHFLIDWCSHLGGLLNSFCYFKRVWARQIVLFDLCESIIWFSLTSWTILNCWAASFHSFKHVFGTPFVYIWCWYLLLFEGSRLHNAHFRLTVIVESFCFWFDPDFGVGWWSGPLVLLLEIEDLLGWGYLASFRDYSSQLSTRLLAPVDLLCILVGSHTAFCSLNNFSYEGIGRLFALHAFEITNLVSCGYLVLVVSDRNPILLTKSVEWFVEVTCTLGACTLLTIFVHGVLFSVVDCAHCRSIVRHRC